jgi:UPF0755 protein
MNQNVSVQQKGPGGSTRRTVLIIISIVILFSLFGISFLTYQAFFSKNHPDGTNIVVSIPQGASFTRISDILHENGVVENRFYFYLTGRLMGWEEEIQSGMFEIPPGKSNYELLRDLRNGMLRKVFDITIQEGLSNRYIAGLLARRMGVDSTKVYTLSHDSAFAAGLGIESSSLKGYLLPDRYRFFGDDTEEAILRRLVAEFWKFYNDSLQARTTELGMSIHEVLIMASIVEGETSLDIEKPIVAGLYYNRIRRRMPLQADATVQYALIEEPPRRLLYRDYRVRSPYNTYLFRGLPPGPINNPGRRAILASLYPAEHNYLYMVTDGTGGHAFSETYLQHQREVRRFRQFRAEQDRLRQQAEEAARRLREDEP